ncbi:DNA primase, partial [Bacteroidales bacterium OttesenSCG-928-M11]|nr:DNA primase [Bacteroidales bacterium OttesenSCG-928-M11]
MIDDATIERIKSAAQIYDVVSDFVNLRKRGVNYVGLCPFHEDTSPSFYVSPAKNICKCFACQEGGTAIHFIMKHENLSYTDALRYLAKKYSIEIKEVVMSDEQKQIRTDKESMFILNGFAQKTFANNLFDTEEGQAIGLSYFRERGFREDIIKKFGLGYSIDTWDAFLKEAEKSGFNRSYLEKTGLVVLRDDKSIFDRFRGRVMFPIYTLSGKVVGFGGRTLRKEDKAKYVNSPESEIYHKSDELYGIYHARQAIVKQDKCFLVEGYTDVISMHQAGIENVVASSGTALTLGQIRLIHRFTKNVTVLYDGDAAGIKAAIRGIDLLLEYGLNIKIVLLPDGEDPDSFAKKQNAESFSTYIIENETDFIRFKVGLLIKEAQNDPAKKVKMIENIVDTIALIPEEIARLVYIKECSSVVGMPEASLARNVARKRQEIWKDKKKSLYPDPETPEVTEDYYSQPKQGQSDVIVNKDLIQYEESILYYLVRYGELTLYKEANVDTNEEKEVKVAEYIFNELKIDELQFSNSSYQQILEEGYSKCNTTDFKAEYYFINHSDPEISRIAVNLSTQIYIESKVHFKNRKQEDESEKLKELI